MLHLVDNKTKKAVRSPRTQTLNPDGLITSSSKSSNSFSAYNLPQSDTVVNTHSMVNMKKSLLPKDRQKSPPTRPAPPQGRGQCDGGTVCGFPHRVKSEVKPVACIKVCAPRSPPNKKDACRRLFYWWTRRDSNPRPPRCERGALPTEPRAHFCADLKFRSPIIARLPGGVKQKPPPELPRRELFLRGNINW